MPEARRAWGRSRRRHGRPTLAVATKRDDHASAVAGVQLQGAERRHTRLRRVRRFVYQARGTSACFFLTPEAYLLYRESPDLRPLRLAYQPPGSSTFLSEQISQQQSAKLVPVISHQQSSATSQMNRLLIKE
jgi:hypothetical protein